ncbi:MAG: RluA family pseudouridine synthase [Nannocystaceae bacterium]|nr:RluA family pseudouridine synthase [Nannocystaceae bacterium]
MPSCHQRNEALVAGLRVLPGSEPYTNRRRLNVGGRFDGLTLRAFLAKRHPHIDVAVWQASLHGRRLELEGHVATSLEQTVRGGNQLVHVLESQIEPDVSSALRFLHEDDDLVVLKKPAPLPVHPSGRFNKNTVLGLIDAVFDDLRVLPVHRLDADTTGVLVLAKNPIAARHLGAQFEARTIGKRYLARVHGSSPRRFEGTAPIARSPDSVGKRTTRSGAPALTHFWTLRRGEQSLIAAWPRSGRTNQIRLHLRDAGHPIVGDRAYGPNADAEFQSGGPLCLHADAIRLRHPSTELWIRFDAPRPSWTSEFLG